MKEDPSMFENLSQLALQQYWWLIVSLLGAIFVFLTFVQGGGTMLFTIAKNEEEKTLLINALGRKWEFYLYYPCNFWRSFLCFLSLVLFYLFWWRLLGMVCHFDLVCHTSHLV